MINIDCHSIDPDEVMRLKLHFDALGQYCLQKADAMRKRLAGDIRGAQRHERTCETIYATLPEDLKW